MSDLYKTLLISRPQVLSSGGSGLLVAANNLSDVADVTTARTNLGAASALTVGTLPSTLASRGYVYSDGSTSNRAQIQTPGTRGNLAGAPVASWVGWVDVPSSTPTTEATVFAIQPNTTVPLQATSIACRFTTTGNFDVIATGATSGDNRRYAWSSFRSTYSGQRIWLEVRLTKGTGNPVIRVNGTDVSASFSTTTSNPPEWLDSSLVATNHLTGYNWPAGPAPLGQWLNAHLTDTESETWRTTGRPPAWVAAGGTMATQTSGTLTIGFRYRITSYVASDSFTNVGAASNATGVEFTATGTTPTTWTNSSVLIRIGALSIPAIQPIPVLDDVTTIEGNQARLLGMIPVTERKDWRIVDSTATNGNEQILGGATFLDTNRHRIDSWVINNLGTSKTVSLGNASAGTQYASSITAAAGLTEVTPSTRFNATTALWVNSNGTDQLVHTITGHRVGSS